MNVKNRKKILQLEDRLIDLMETIIKYEDIPSIYFDIQIKEILIELERLEGV